MSIDVTEMDRCDCEKCRATKQIKVIYLDDDPIDHRIMRIALRNHDPMNEYDVTFVSDIDEANDILDTMTPEIFITDNRMPGVNNFHDTLSKTSNLKKSTKIVVISSATEGREFEDFSELEFQPSAIIEKSRLSHAIRDGLLRSL